MAKREMYYREQHVQKTGALMASDEEGSKRGRGRPPREAEKSPQAREPQRVTSGGIKVMAAFRIPQALHEAMTAEARLDGLDLTTCVNRLFHGFLYYFGLPRLVGERLEEDRRALEVSRFEYFQYLLFRRYEAVTKQGPGFDLPGAQQRK
jgi:hypothetical protein